MNPPNIASSTQFQKLLTSGSYKNTNPPGGTNQAHQITEAPIIKDVWEDNFEEEFRIITDLIERYPVIAMDTEFPGTVYELEDHELSPLGHYEMKYKKIKMNVDKLKVIQVGISLSDEEGNLPPGFTIWQFNLKFNLHTDEYSKDAIKLLMDAGLKFDTHAKKGINPQQFAEYIIGSGMIMNRDTKWVVFDGGYDFAYLIRMFEGQNLPDTEAQFYGLLNIYFPNFYDVRHMVRDIETLRMGGLSKIATELNLKRFGTMHQAGSDALLTLSTFFKIKKTYIKTDTENKYINVLDGISQHGDDLWRKSLVSDYNYMMYNGYSMHNMQMMDSQYYGQTEAMYNSVANNPYKMPFYSNYTTNPYQEPAGKAKKYETSTGKAKNGRYPGKE